MHGRDPGQAAATGDWNGARRIGYDGVVAFLRLTDMHERIDINPLVMRGKPVIRGTRIPVELILRKLGAGMTVDEVIADHPRLTVDDIRAAQAFAADYIADEDVVYE